ncbi:hypothetical protein [Streptomyces sp. NPDC002491]
MTKATTRATAADTGVAVPAAGTVVTDGIGAAVVAEGGAAVAFGAAVVLVRTVVLVGAGGEVTFGTCASGLSGAGAAVPGEAAGEIVGETGSEAVVVGFADRTSHPRRPSQDVFLPSVHCPPQDVFLPSVQLPPEVAVTASSPASPMHAMAADGTATTPVTRTATAMCRLRVFLRCLP